MSLKYSETIFEIRDTDKTPEFFPDINTQSFKDFPCYATSNLNEIVKLTESGNFEENDELYDTLYRQTYIIYKMADIYGIRKISHLLQILNFIMDYSRVEKTYKKHSFDYLISVISEAVTSIFADFLNTGKNSRDISDLIEEAKTYLQTPLNAWNKKIENTPSEITQTSDSSITETCKDQDEVHNIEKNTVTSCFESPSVVLEKQISGLEKFKIDLDLIPCNDEPEYLDIPMDKTGMISDFCEEMKDVLNRIAKGLIELETSDANISIINDLFRNIHTIKGGARLLKIMKIEFLTHNLENLLDLLRKGDLNPTTMIIDILIEAKQLLDEMLGEVASRGPIYTRIGQVLCKLNSFYSGHLSGSEIAVQSVVSLPKVIDSEKKDKNTEDKETIKSSETDVPELKSTPVSQNKIKTSDKNKITESIRVSAEKLDEVLNTASEIFISRIRFQNDITAIKNLLKSFKLTLNRTDGLEPSVIMTRLENNITAFVKDLNYLINKYGAAIPDTDIQKLFLSYYRNAIGAEAISEMTLQEELNLNYLTIDDVQKQLQKNLETLEHLSSRLQTGAMSFRMVPISSLFERFPMQLREIAKQVGKKIKVEVIGGDTELDKVLINRLVDPLLHILRNSVDHGIEKPEQRIAAGKSEIGLITLNTYYYGSHAIIEVTDDGNGIDPDKVFNKAVEKGLADIVKRNTLTDKEIFDYIFMPGFSTADQVSELSGRGVGMDVVKTALNQLHGSVEIESKPGNGTTIKLKLPLTLAIVRILLVQESSFQFALPILNVDEIITIQLRDINKINDRLIYNFRGKTIPVTKLSSILNFQSSDFSANEIQMIVMNENNKKLGILVDSILGRQEILIKNLGKLLKRAPYVMGCTILRDSKLVLILDAREIIVSYDKITESIAIDLTTDKPQEIENKSSILIIDDSSMQRDFIKNILNRALYTNVDTVENGFEALKVSRNKTYTAFCVDVVMPLMDGYEFIERLRKLEVYKKTPVFLITTRETSELDEQRGINLNITKKFKKPIDEHLFIETINQYLKER